MTWPRFGCRKFSRLLSERVDRPLSDAELRFMARHRRACRACAQEESFASLSLNMLRMADSAEDDREAVVSPQFDQRLLRRYRVEQMRGSVRYWSPALVGGVLAAAALVVTLQALSSPNTPPRVPKGENQVRRDIPNSRLDLGNQPVQLR